MKTILKQISKQASLLFIGLSFSLGTISPMQDIENRNVKDDLIKVLKIYVKQKKMKVIKFGHCFLGNKQYTREEIQLARAKIAGIMITVLLFWMGVWHLKKPTLNKPNEKTESEKDKNIQNQNNSTNPSGQESEDTQKDQSQSVNTKNQENKKSDTEKKEEKEEEEGEPDQNRTPVERSSTLEKIIVWFWPESTGGGAPGVEPPGDGGLSRESPSGGSIS